MELIQLTSDYEMKPFDCGDAALNGFLFNRICNSIVLRIRIYNHKWLKDSFGYILLQSLQ